MCLPPPNTSVTSVSPSPPRIKLHPTLVSFRADVLVRAAGRGASRYGLACIGPKPTIASCSEPMRGVPQSLHTEM